MKINCFELAFIFCLKKRIKNWNKFLDIAITIRDWVNKNRTYAQLILNEGEKINKQLRDYHKKHFRAI